MISKSYAVFNGIPLPKRKSLQDKLEGIDKEIIHSMKNTIRIEAGLPTKPRVVTRKRFPIIKASRSIVRSSRD